MVNKPFLPPEPHPGKTRKTLTSLHFLKWHGFR
jgi:hypothetical protein